MWSQRITGMTSTAPISRPNQIPMQLGVDVYALKREAVTDTAKVQCRDDIYNIKRGQVR